MYGREKMVENHGLYKHENEDLLYVINSDPN